MCTCSTGPVVCTPSAMLLNFSLASLPAAAAPCSVPPRCSGDGLRSCSSNGGRQGARGEAERSSPARARRCRRERLLGRSRPGLPRCSRRSTAAAAAPRHPPAVSTPAGSRAGACKRVRGAGRPGPGVLAHLDGRGSASSAVLGGRAAHRPLDAGAGADRRGGAGDRRALHYRLPALLLVNRGGRAVPKEGAAGAQHILRQEIAGVCCCVLCSHVALPGPLGRPCRDRGPIHCTGSIGG